MDQYIPVHERMRHYIDDVAKLSRKRVAANAGVTESCLSLWLNGKRSIQIDDYEKLCRAIAVEPTRFFNV